MRLCCSWINIPDYSANNTIIRETSELPERYCNYYACFWNGQAQCISAFNSRCQTPWTVESAIFTGIRCRESHYNPTFVHMHMHLLLFFSRCCVGAQKSSQSVLSNLHILELVDGGFKSLSPGGENIGQWQETLSASVQQVWLTVWRTNFPRRFPLWVCFHHTRLEVSVCSSVRRSHPQLYGKAMIQSCWARLILKAFISVQGNVESWSAVSRGIGDLTCFSVPQRESNTCMVGAWYSLQY